MPGFLLFVQSVWVYVFLSLKVFIFCGAILEISHEPLVCNCVLLSLPTFIKKSHPDKNKKSVNEAVRSVEYLVVLLPITYASLNSDE